MSDAIELLDAIGRDASLYRASPQELGKKLEQADASEGLKAAVASGDISRLFAELGQKPMYAPQISQTAHEEEEPAPAEDEADLPVPDPGQSSLKL